MTERAKPATIVAGSQKVFGAVEKGLAWLATLIAITAVALVVWLVWSNRPPKEVTEAKEAADRAAKAPKLVPAPAPKSRFVTEVPEADKRCAEDWCTPRLLASGSTERVYVGRWDVCWDNNIRKLPQLNLKVSQRGVEKSCTSLPCGTFDTFWFTPEKGVEVPSHQFIPGGRADLC